MEESLWASQTATVAATRSQPWALVDPVGLIDCGGQITTGTYYPSTHSGYGLHLFASCTEVSNNRDGD